MIGEVSSSSSIVEREVGLTVVNGRDFVAASFTANGVGTFFLVLYGLAAVLR